MHRRGDTADGAGGAELPELGPVPHDAERLDADVHADPARATNPQLPGLQPARLQRPSLLSGHAGSAFFFSQKTKPLDPHFWSPWIRVRIRNADQDPCLIIQPQTQKLKCKRFQNNEFF